VAFAGMRWQDVGFDPVQRCSDARFRFAPEAFRRYLPGLRAASP
jgi:hypothetical protein